MSQQITYSTHIHNILGESANWIEWTIAEAKCVHITHTHNHFTECRSTFSCMHAYVWIFVELYAGTLPAELSSDHGNDSTSDDENFWHVLFWDPSNPWKKKGLRNRGRQHSQDNFNAMVIKCNIVDTGIQLRVIHQHPRLLYIHIYI